jgi:hypothetical protein
LFENSSAADVYSRCAPLSNLYSLRWCDEIFFLYSPIDLTKSEQKPTVSKREFAMKSFLIGLSLSLLPALSGNLLVATSTLAQEKVRIGISGLGPGFIPSIVAEKKGLYLKYGLATEHVAVSLAIAMNALGTGDLDYAESVAQGITAAARGFPVKLVMCR